MQGETIISVGELKDCLLNEPQHTSQLPFLLPSLHCPRRALLRPTRKESNVPSRHLLHQESLCAEHRVGRAGAGNVGLLLGRVERLDGDGRVGGGGGHGAGWARSGRDLGEVFARREGGVEEEGESRSTFETALSITQVFAPRVLDLWLESSDDDADEGLSFTLFLSQVVNESTEIPLLERAEGNGVSACDGHHPAVYFSQEGRGALADSGSSGKRREESSLILLETYRRGFPSSQQRGEE